MPPTATAEAVVAVAALPPILSAAAVPERLVAVIEEGVPPAPSNRTGAPALPVLAASAVKIPVPVVTVAGAAPAPPPTTSALAASAADVAQVEVELK